MSDERKTEPRDASACAGLALACLQADKPAEAMAHLTRALELNPSYSQAHNILGRVMHKAGRKAEARDCFLRAIHGDAESADAHNNLGVLLADDGSLCAAAEHYRRATQLEPDFAMAWNNLGSLLRHQGRIDEAVECGRKAVSTAPANAVYHSNLLYWQHCLPGMSPQQLLTEARSWAQRHAPPQSCVHPNIPEPTRRLKIGCISPDVRDHSVAFFLEPFVSLSADLEVYCYAEVTAPDATSDYFKSRFKHWRGTVGLPAKQVADMIRSDGIDILVDLAGHTANNRLDVLALKPAPIQITYLGYPGTTGMSAVDYRLSDIWSDPPGCEDGYSETLIRLPCGFLCYTPPDEAPPLSSPPSEATNCVSFGSFNALAKTNDEVVKVWARILSVLPGTRLFLKNACFKDSPIQQRYVELFGKHGIAVERLKFAGAVEKRAEHLRLYNEVDIALDPFPYNGTTTTCEALWMGVPVIALVGDAHVSRVSVSILSRAGLPDCLASSLDDYVSKAIGLAKDPVRLGALRQALRPQLAGSSLCQLTSFSAALETALRGVWEQWCAQQPKPSAAVRTVGVPSGSAQQAETQQQAPAPTLSRLTRPMECAMLADCNARAGLKTVAASYAREGLSRLRRGEPAGTVASLLLSDWQAPALDALLLRQSLTLSSSSSYFNPGQGEELLAWAQAEPGNPEPFLRMGLLHALQAARQGLPCPAQAIDALQLAAGATRDTRAQRALELLQKRPSELALPYDETFIHVPPDIRALCTYVLLEQGDWFEEELDLFRALIHPGDAVLDCGANLGMFALSAARRVGEQGKVVAVESAQENCALLSKSATRHANTLKVRCAIIGDAPRTTSSREKGPEIVSIDSLSSAYQMARSDLLRVDAQGSAALNGGARHLQSCSPIIFYKVDREGEALNLAPLQILAGLGYQCFVYNAMRKAVMPIRADSKLAPECSYIIAAREAGLERLAATVQVL